MMWDRVIERLRALMLVDGVLEPVFGDNVRMAGSGASPSPKVSMIEYTLVADSEDELWAPCVIQFDVWAPTFDKVTIGERRLRQLFNPPLPIELEGVMMWAQYVEGNLLASPDRDGFSGRAVRFRFTPLRERYASISPS